MAKRTPPKRKYASQDLPEKTATRGSKNVSALEGKVIRYLEARKEETAAKNIKAELSKELKQAAVDLGVEENGSHTLELPGGSKIGNIRTVKNKVDPSKAEAVLKNLGIYDRCTKRILDESELERCFQEGLIDMAEIDSFTEEIESFRVDVRGPK